MPYPSFETLTIHHDQDPRVAILTIRREKHHNALSRQVIAELLHAAAALEQATDVRAVVVTGAGEKAFVAGADIAEMAEMTPLQAQALAEHGGALATAIEASDKPWIAAVNGFAFGGGCELAIACDFIYASENAQFGQPEVKLGVIPGFGGTQRLARRLGVAKAKQLCMTGDVIAAAEALRIGLVDAVVPAHELMTSVTAVAGRIADNGPLAVAEVKRLIHLGQSMPLGAALALERRSFGIMFSTADQKHGMAAFLAKPRRPASFKGQ